MSRYYRVEIDLSVHALVHGWASSDDTPFAVSAALAKLSQEGFEMGSEYTDDDTLTVAGHMTLTGGENPYEAHARLANTLGTRLASRWLNLDEQPWDVEIEMDEEGDE